MKRKRSVPCLAAAILAFASSPAEACCHRGARRCGHHRIVYARPVAAPAAYAAAPAVSAPAPAAYASPPQPVAQAVAAPSAVAPTPAEAPGVQPMYRYAAGEGTPAYYYTYDSSGKLIVQQWVDWVFRGGKEAGMPRPPLPIIGNFVGRR